MTDTLFGNISLMQSRRLASLLSVRTCGQSVKQGRRHEVSQTIKFEQASACGGFAVRSSFLPQSLI